MDTVQLLRLASVEDFLVQFHPELDIQTACGRLVCHLHPPFCKVEAGQAD